MKEVDKTYGRLWSVVTLDRNKARKIISEIEHGYDVKVNYKKDNRNELSVFFEDGVWLRWVKPIDNARGYRHGKLWCDKSISYDDLELHFHSPCSGKVFIKYINAILRNICGIWATNKVVIFVRITNSKESIGLKNEILPQ